MIVGAVVTFSTAVETIARSATFVVNVVFAVANAVTVFAETVAITGIAAAAVVFAVFVATIAVTAEFNVAIWAFAASTAASTTAVLGSGIGTNGAP